LMLNSTQLFSLQTRKEGTKKYVYNISIYIYICFTLDEASQDSLKNDGLFMMDKSHWHILQHPG
jgi:hypothetical protein